MVSIPPKRKWKKTEDRAKETSLKKVWRDKNMGHTTGQDKAHKIMWSNIYYFEFQKKEKDKWDRNNVWEELIFELSLYNKII